ncbi:hypothetical protein [Kingella oralis]|uniref:hypothetical protein n=1 Tax=Kingella oralis TaxID=505 RepID=UPI0002D74D93|nr:hypothetical protein [Kingella oralis]QMT43549.1 hypothetical protein H3L93_04235 [Kingella oralis]
MVALKTRFQAAVNRQSKGSLKNKNAHFTRKAVFRQPETQSVLIGFSAPAKHPHKPVQKPNR